MNIGITGVTGLIGTALAALCQQRGHRVTGFSRSVHGSLPNCNVVRLFGDSHPVDLSGLDALVHLAGEPVVGLWTREKRRRILSSRRDTTRHLVENIQRGSSPLRVFLCASGTGFYGDRSSEKLDENSTGGSGFLADVCEEWEAQARAVGDRGVRHCQLRTGMVLSRDSGAFPLLRRVFSLALGGRIGSGRQYLPWIHVDDIAALYLHALENDALSGPINAVAPEECTNGNFTRALAAALHRPALFPVPGFLLKAALGDLSGIVLDSQRVSPQAALESGFAYRFPSLQMALEALCE